MPSNMFSRLGGATAAGRSFYEELRALDDESRIDNSGPGLDEENLRHQFTDYEAAAGLEAGDSRLTVASGPIGGHARPLDVPQTHPAADHSKWPHPDDDLDNDVPTSLLIEPNDRNKSFRIDAHAMPVASAADHAPSTAQAREMWEAVTSQQALHPDDLPSVPPRTRPRSVLNTFRTSSARDKAMWRWVNVTNLDSFVRDVYNYYEGGGIWVIQSSNALQLL